MPPASGCSVVSDRDGELFRLLELFSQNEIRALVIQGPVLAAQAYGDASLRRYGDLDLPRPPTQHSSRYCARAEPGRFRRNEVSRVSALRSVPPPRGVDRPLLSYARRGDVRSQAAKAAASKCLRERG